jgi:hypothetical protein
MQALHTDKCAFDNSCFCRVTVSPLGRTLERICPFCTMATDTHAWPEISGKTGERFEKDAWAIPRGHRVKLERIVRSDLGFSAI